jgi:hypothetical protein
MERMPARTAALMPSVACACAITKTPAAVASSTSTASSSSRKWPCRGSSRGDSTPPEVATLITSAPARISSRTLRRISAGPSTIPDGRPGCAMKIGSEHPDGCQESPCPPVWLSIEMAICMRGPRISPFAWADWMPRSAPEASRTVVMPVASVFSRLRAASKNCSENGAVAASSGLIELTVTCTWQSNSPGSTVNPAQSTASSASRPVPTSTMRPSSTTTSARAGAAPDPSKTSPPVNTVRVTPRTVCRRPVPRGRFAQLGDRELS